MAFTHLHLHTEYSLLDGAAKIEKVLDRAKELGQTAVAITDHGSMCGVIDFYRYAKKIGIKPVIGCEVYTAPRTLYDKSPEYDSNYGHLVLLAKNNTGYNNLMKIVSKSYVDGFYYKPRVDMKLLSKYSDGIIALSACLAGDVPKLILNNDTVGAIEKINQFINIFGEENFFLEIQDHGLEDQKKVNLELINIARSKNIKLVATNDVHYVKQEDSFVQDVLMCIQMGKEVDDPYRLKYETDQFYLKSEEEMREIFGQIPDAIENTQKIADMCNVEFSFDERHLPEFKLPDGETSSYEYLEKLCYKGFKERYTDNTEAEERLNYELGVINKMGFTDYFLIVWDLIRFARDNNIPVGPGRGSAAGSIVSYCLRITDIDPLKYALIFERFLNSERVSMPDIDMDFCYERRQEVIDYATRRYGEDHVAQIITFGTLAAKAAIKDVGRALGMPYALCDEVAKMIPNELKITIEKALKINKKLSDSYESDPKIKKLIDTAMAVEGMPRHASTHAAGVVITGSPVSDYVPLYRNGDLISTQFPMTTLEELGLLKMDFLGLRTLTVIKDAVDLVGEIDDIEKIDFNHPEVYEMIGNGDTEGVFQLESAGMKKFMKELKPKSLEDIIAGISLYRPGPMDSIPMYVYNKNHIDKVTYLHPALEPILKVTYGCIVYQEQVMEIVRKLAGFSMGQSDQVRRAMSKKKEKEMVRVRKEFIHGIVDDEGNVVVPGAVRNGVPEDVANEIIDKIMDFAKYAFNKSHAAAYAVVAYRTAFLKAKYPVQFMAALMSSFIENTEKISEYIELCRKMGMQVREPDVNKSILTFSVELNNIRYGLAAVKNVGRNFVKDLIEERQKNGEFKDFKDFCLRMVTYGSINKKAIESLVKCGAFDCLGVFRSQLMLTYAEFMKNAIDVNKSKVEGQMSIFASASGDEDFAVIKLPDIPEMDIEEKLKNEKETLGIYISGHPLDKVKGLYESRVNCNSSMIRKAGTEESELNDNDLVIFAAVTESKKEIYTKRNDKMAFMRVADKYGSVETVLFGKVYERFEKLTEEGSLIMVYGKVNARDEKEPVVLVDKIEPLDGASLSKKLYLRITAENKDKLNDVLSLAKRNRGEIPVLLYFEDEKITKRTDMEYWVRDTYELSENLKRILGEENVKYVSKS